MNTIEMRLQQLETTNRRYKRIVIVMMAFFAEHPLKVNVVDFPTTAENLAAHLLDEIASRLREQVQDTTHFHLQRLRVRVQETERTYAEVWRDF